LATVERGVTHFTQGSGEGGWGAARADLVGWAVERVTGPAERLHGLGIPDGPARLLRWCHAATPALVLGSAEPDAHVDHAAAAAAGLGVVRRRSGGSSVVVGPGRVAWLDVVVPADDPLWADDVGVAPLWLGRTWVEALDALGVRGAGIHVGPMLRPPWSSHVCFAGTGPGEVTTAQGKVVGISQRRTRGAALFQCGVLLRWDPVEAVSGLAVDRARAAHELRDAAVGVDALVGRPVGVDAIEAAFSDAVRALAVPHPIG
jgi:lipoate-protein ligase A